MTNHGLSWRLLLGLPLAASLAIGLYAQSEQPKRTGYFPLPVVGSTSRLQKLAWTPTN